MPSLAVPCAAAIVRIKCRSTPESNPSSGVPEDEWGHITGSHGCFADDGKPLMFVMKKGQVLRVQSFYRTAVDDDPDLNLPMAPGGSHTGAMAYVPMTWRRWSPDVVPLKYT